MNFELCILFSSTNLVYGWRNWYVFEHPISATEKGYWAAIFTASINTNRLLSNNACSTSNNSCCTVTFSSGSNTSILICKQLVHLTTLVDF
jgi:hypothetical protein